MKAIITRGWSMSHPDFIIEIIDVEEEIIPRLRKETRWSEFYDGYIRPLSLIDRIPWNNLHQEMREEGWHNDAIQSLRKIWWKHNYGASLLPDIQETVYTL